MKALLAYYSNTGHNEMLAKKLEKLVDCDVEAIVDLADRPKIAGEPSDKQMKKINPMAMFSTGFTVILRQGTWLKPIEKDPADYDILIMGTPLWMGNLPPAARTYARKVKGKVKKLALFCVDGKTEPSERFHELESIIGAKAVSTFWLTSDNVEKGGYDAKLKEFVKSLNA